MERLIRLLPLKYKRRINKLLRKLGLVAPTVKRVRAKKSGGTAVSAPESSTPAQA